MKTSPDTSHDDKSPLKFIPSGIERYIEKDREATLPGLNLKVQLPQGTHLYVNGPTEDMTSFNTELFLRARGHIQEHTTALGRIFGGAYDSLKIYGNEGAFVEKVPGIRTSVALCLEQPLMAPRAGETLFAISKQRGLEKSMDAFADGYASGKFLEKNGMQALIQPLLEQLGIAIDISTLSGDEFADFCGFIAIKNAGILYFPEFKANRESRETMAKQLGLKPSEEIKEPKN